MSELKTKAEPFVKWAGGKSQLLKEYRKLYPKNFNTYFEPFLGSGAVFLDLYTLKKIKKAVLSDINKDLMNLWAAIKENVDDLISHLEELQRHVNNKDYYYKKRKEFNSIKLSENFISKPNIRKAALFLYLNKTCYNGLYRVNSKGEFNVPFGKYENPRIYDEKNLRVVHNILKDDDKITLLCTDFEEAIENAGEGDFIYFDPPYQPISETSSFTKYTPNGFGHHDQVRLSKVFRQFDEKGCYVMLSNSSNKVFLKPLYKPYFEKGYVIEVKANRFISCNGDDRGPVKELVILNYPLDT